MKHRKVNISNPKNIYCAHCCFWHRVSENTNSKVCCCSDSLKFNNITKYWERCPMFDWKDDIKYQDYLYLPAGTFIIFPSLYVHGHDIVYKVISYDAVNRSYTVNRIVEHRLINSEETLTITDMIVRRPTIKPADMQMEMEL